MLSLVSASTGALTIRPWVPEGKVVDIGPQPWSSSEISDAEGLKALAKAQNPIVGYWDPLEIGQESKEQIAWFRHAEIKHGRVAMAAFVGFEVQRNGIHFPGQLSLNMVTGDAPVTFADISAAGGPADQWDALPTAAKMQIILAIGALELWGESTYAFGLSGQQHYVRGGKPGVYPAFKKGSLPLNLFDPFGLTGKMTPERKEKALLAEVNNGRFAMIGIFGLISVSKGLIVPGLDTLPIAPYAGEYMAPFAANNVDLPGVQFMLEHSPTMFY